MSSLRLLDDDAVHAIVEMPCHFHLSSIGTRSNAGVQSLLGVAESTNTYSSMLAVNDHDDIVYSGQSLGRLQLRKYGVRRLHIGCRVRVAFECQFLDL